MEVLFYFRGDVDDEITCSAGKCASCLLDARIVRGNEE
jgi:hypothetical protein